MLTTRLTVYDHENTTSSAVTRPENTPRNNEMVKQICSSVVKKSNTSGRDYSISV